MGCSNPEGHEAHMELNGECPWCGDVGESNPELDTISDADAVAHLERKHG